MIVVMAASVRRTLKNIFATEMELKSCRRMSERINGLILDNKERMKLEFIERLS